MKRFLTFALIAMIMITGCRDGVRNNNAGTNQEVPTPPTPPNPQPSIKELKEDEVLKAFSITKGEITASAAAKKIAKGLPSPSSEITFTEIKIISYDDESGEFKISFKGTKKDGTSFEKTITFTQFTHPLNGKAIQSSNKIDLSFDEAIEHNYSLDLYIEKLNEKIKEKTMLKELSFMLSDSSTIIELGEHEKYTLIASAEKDEFKVRIKPQVVYLKLFENATNEIKENISDFSFTHLKTLLTKDYFIDKDVFKYILDKLDETIVIKENKKEFASSFYVFAKHAGTAPDNIFTEEFKTYIKHYHDIYEEKNENEHLKLDIGYGVYDPKNGGVDSDDYEGSLKINLCIATNEQIADQNGIVATKNIQKIGGFANIPDDASLGEKKHLFFNLIPKATLTDEMKTTWEKKPFDNYFLLKVNENGVATVNNPFDSASNPFNLCVNSENTNPRTHLGCATYGASKTKNENVIFIEAIRLKKDINSKSMEVLITLKGSNQIELKTTVTPY